MLACSLSWDASVCTCQMTSDHVLGRTVGSAAKAASCVQQDCYSVFLRTQMSGRVTTQRISASEVGKTEAKQQQNAPHNVASLAVEMRTGLHTVLLICLHCRSNSKKLCRCRGPRDLPQIRNIALEKHCVGKMTSKKNTQCHRICYYCWICPMSLVAFINKISILHRFRDINAYFPPKNKKVTRDRGTCYRINSPQPIAKKFGKGD